MTTEEALQKKRELEGTIRDLVTTFQSETGRYVSSVDLEYRWVRLISTEVENRKLAAVHLTVEL